MYTLSLGVVLTGPATSVGATTTMGDGTNLVHASNSYDDYSAIYLGSGHPSGTPVLFRCATGQGPSGSDGNNRIGHLYYNDMELADDGTCSGLLQAEGTENVFRFPGVYQARLCSALTTSTEGVYTCILTNSSNMLQSVRVGVYFNGRSESLYNV